MFRFANFQAVGRVASTGIRQRVSGLPKYPPLRPAEILGTRRELPCRPGLYEPAQIERVRRCGFGRRLAQQMEVLDATTYRSTPVMRYRLRDALLLGGEIFHAEGRTYLGDMGGLATLRAPIVELDRAVSASTFLGARFFGHWLRDDCALHELLAGMGPRLAVRRPDWPDAPLYEAAFGQDWRPTAAARVGWLDLFSDIGFSPDKARRLHRLRAKLRAAHAAAAPGRIVYIRRGPGGAPRPVVGEDALAAALEARGVTILDAEADAAHLVRHCLDARLVISVEGSQIAHATYGLAEGGALLVLQPPDRFYNPHIEWTRILGMSYGIVVGQAAGDGFRIDTGEVCRMVDRLLAEETRSMVA